MAISLPLTTLVPHLITILKSGDVVVWGLLERLGNVSVKSNNFQNF